MQKPTDAHSSMSGAVITQEIKYTYPSLFWLLGSTYWQLGDTERRAASLQIQTKTG